MKLNSVEMLQYIENRYPFLMIDEILECDPGKYAIAKKNVSINEWYMKGHFPGNPVMPGTLQLEAMFNTAAIAINTIEDNDDNYSVISKVNNASFKRNVKPGMTLIVRADVIRNRRGICEIKAEIICEQDVVAVAEFILAYPNKIINVLK